MKNKEIKSEQILEGKLVFGAEYPGGKEEVLRLEKGKFFYMGQEVKDVNKIYERFSEWMSLADKDYINEKLQKKIVNRLSSRANRSSRARKNEVVSCPLCSADLPKAHRLRTGK